MSSFAAVEVAEFTGSGSWALLKIGKISEEMAGFYRFAAPQLVAALATARLGIAQIRRHDRHSIAKTTEKNWPRDERRCAILLCHRADPTGSVRKCQIPWEKRASGPTATVQPVRSQR